MIERIWRILVLMHSEKNHYEIENCGICIELDAIKEFLNAKYPKGPDPRITGI